MMPRAELPALRCRTPRFAVNQFKVSPERTLLTRPEAARQRLDPICVVRGRTQGRSQGATRSCRRVTSARRPETEGRLRTLTHVSEEGYVQSVRRQHCVPSPQRPRVGRRCLLYLLQRRHNSVAAYL